MYFKMLDAVKRLSQKPCKDKLDEKFKNERPSPDEAISSIASCVADALAFLSVDFVHEHVNKTCPSLDLDQLGTNTAKTISKDLALVRGVLHIEMIRAHWKRAKMEQE